MVSFTIENMTVSFQLTMPKKGANFGVNSFSAAIDEAMAVLFRAGALEKDELGLVTRERI